MNKEKLKRYIRALRTGTGMLVALIAEGFNEKGNFAIAYELIAVSAVLLWPLIKHWFWDMFGSEYVESEIYEYYADDQEDKCA